MAESKFGESKIKIEPSDNITSDNVITNDLVKEALSFHSEDDSANRTEKFVVESKELTVINEELRQKTEAMTVKTEDLIAETAYLTVETEEWEHFFDSKAAGSKSELGSDSKEITTEFLDIAESNVKQTCSENNCKSTYETDDRLVSRCFVKLERFPTLNLLSNIKSEQDLFQRTKSTVKLKPDDIRVNQSSGQTSYNTSSSPELETRDDAKNNTGQGVDDFARVKNLSLIDFKKDFEKKPRESLPYCYVKLQRLSSKVLSSKIKIEGDAFYGGKLLLYSADIGCGRIKVEEDDLNDSLNLSQQETHCSKENNSFSNFSSKSEIFTRKGKFIPPTEFFSSMEFWNVENFKCDHCSKEFSQKCCLQHHIRNHSLYSSVYAEGEMAQRVHRCRVDPNSKNEKLTLNTNNYSNIIEKQILNTYKTQSKTILPVQNPLSKSFKKYEIWKDLIPEEHVCEICNRSCKNERAFKCHMKFHEKPRFLQCPVCPFIVKREDYFKNHLMSHSNLGGFDVNKYLKTFQNQTQDVFYHCRFCASKFKEIEELKNHIKSHDVSRPFQCASCPYKTNRRGDLNKHIMQVHDNVLSYSCPSCPAKFKIKGTLMQHLACHKKESSFQCQLCPSKFKSVTRLNQHLHTHKFTLDYPCPSCPSKFKKWSELQQHMSTHVEVRPYQCPSCPYKAKKKYDLKVHIRRCHSESRPHQCPMCPSKFKAKRDLQEHIKRLHSDVYAYQCPSCPSRFKNKKDLKRHEMRHVKVRLYQCPSCPYKGKTGRDLTLHTENHSKDWSHQCSICPMKFKARKTFWKHTQTHRQTPSHRQTSSHVGDRQFECSLCPKKFDNFLVCENHMEAHNSKKEYMCEHCGIYLKNLGRYNQHVRLHLRSKKLMIAVSCALCREQIKGRALLRKHYEWHEKEEKDPLCFECDICKVKFRTKCFLRDHIKTEHREKTK